MLTNNNTNKMYTIIVQRQLTQEDSAAELKL